MLEGQGHFSKGGGPEPGLPGCIGAGWVHFSGVVGVCCTNGNMNKNCCAEQRHTFKRLGLQDV